MIRAALVLLLLLPACGSPSCPDDEAAALAALPLPQGAIEVERGAGDGVCILTFETPLPAPEVRDHYATSLSHRGWDLTDVADDGDLAGAFSATLVAAEQDQLSVTVDFEDLAQYTESRPGSHVALNLSGRP